MKNRLEIFGNIVADGLDTGNMIKALDLIGAPSYDAGTLEHMKIYSDYLPMMEEDPYTQEQRYLHILWEAIDGVPLGIDCSFSIPYRSIIAHKLFRKCGKGFIASPGCRFNYGHRISVGDNVAWNTGIYIDSKGMVEMGDFVMLAEQVNIFSHSHCEDNHEQRIYKPVKIGLCAKISCRSTVMCGVTVGEGACVGASAVVTRDVPAGMVVAGVPAKVIRPSNCNGKSLHDTNHYYFCNRAFQED